VTNYDFNLDATKEKNMTFSQTYRTALIAIAGSLLTAVFHTEAVAQTKSPQGVRNIVIVHGAWADGSSWSRVIPLLQAKGLHVVAVQNPLTSLGDDVAVTKRAIALQDGPVLLTATQGPTAAAVFGATITTAAWKTKPSWCVIASNDRAVSPELQKAEAAAMKATSITVPSSHVPMLSQPKAVADLIEQAAAKAGSQ
jgi:pimeloyl-ACP methyl ester carboxylesterase